MGIIIHGSRSNAPSRTRLQEYDGTRTYAENSYIPAGDYYTGWLATIGDGRWSLHYPPDRWGNNAGQDGTVRHGLEFAQAVEAWEISDEQCAAFADCYKTIIVPEHGEYDLMATDVLVRHSTLPQGISAGKSDVFSRTATARWNDLKTRLAKACGQ